MMRKIETRSNNTTNSSIILQFLIKLDAYSIDYILSGASVLACNKRLLDY